MPLFKCQGQLLKSVIVSGGNVIGDVLKVVTKPLLSIIEFQWYRDNSIIENATSNTYKVNGADVGKQVHCVAKLHGHPVDSNWKDAVVTPSVSLSYSHSDCLVGTALTADVGKTHDEVSYQWYREYDKIPYATGKTYWINGSDVGKRIHCKITTGGYTVDSGWTGYIPAPTCSISGDHVLGSTLTCSVDGTNADYSYQWYRENSAISNATGKTYWINGSDVGKRIHCKITTGGYTVDSGWTGYIPAPTCSIGGSSYVGSVLSCYVGKTHAIVSYQWYRDGTELTNYREWQYRVSKDDANHVVKCLITTAGYSVWSNATSQIPVPKVRVNGAMIKGRTLTADLIDAKFDSLTYTWYRQNWATITNDSTYTLQQHDVGYTIYCSISDGHGNDIGSGWLGPVANNWIGPFSEEKKDPNNGNYRNTASVSWSFNPGVRLISAYSEGASSHEEYGRAKIYISTSDGRYNNTLVRESEPMNTAWISWDGDLENVTYVRCEIDGTVNKKNCTGQIKYYRKG